MFGKNYRLFTLFGFEVKLDLSWLLLGLLITWSLARGFFPSHYKDLAPALYWFMGSAGALGLFASIVFHEFFHSLTARRFGLRIKGITLFIFGGVAEMHNEPTSPRAEFFMAMAGPVSSVCLGILFYLLFMIGGRVGLPNPARGVLEYLSIINIVLALFNMVPAFPLDGGRVLRSALWKWKNNFRLATRIASQTGAAFGMVLIFLGVINILTGNAVGGVWWVILGIFLRNAAGISYRQLLIQNALKGERIEGLMSRDPVAVPSSVTISGLVENFIYRYDFKFFPVVRDGKLFGCVATKNLRDVPREKWNDMKTEEVSRSCTEENTVSPDMDALQALSIMNKTGNSRLIVADGQELVGVITMKDILKLLSLKMDLIEKM